MPQWQSLLLKEKFVQHGRKSLRNYHVRSRMI